jgi:hypothetical protein
MKREPNKADALKAEMTLWLQPGNHWHGVGDLRRSHLT